MTASVTRPKPAPPKPSLNETAAKPAQPDCDREPYQPPSPDDEFGPSPFTPGNGEWEARMNITKDRIETRKIGSREWRPIGSHPRIRKTVCGDDYFFEDPLYPERNYWLDQESVQ